MKDKQPTILFVDDEPNVLKAIKRLFNNEPWRLLFANGGGEALTLLAQEPVDMVVSDVRMPNMDGIERLTQVRQQDPSIVRILLTGYSTIDSVTRAHNDGISQQTISKPWNSKDLLAILRSALRQSAQQRQKSK